MPNPTSITVKITTNVSDETAGRAAKLLDWWMKDNFLTEEDASYHWEEVKQAISQKLFEKMQGKEHEADT